MSCDWKAGLALSLATAALWGFLPIVIKGVLKEFDPFTTTWFRFLGGAALLGVWLLLRRPSSLRPPATLRARLLLALAILCMSGNFTLFALSLSYQSPSVTQTVLQLGPPLVFLGGAFLFKEPIGRSQWFGFAILLSGLGLFFNTKIPLLFGGFGPQTLGVVLVVLSALCFASYSLSQKALIGEFKPESALFYALFCGILLMAPFASPSQILHASPTGLLLLFLAVLHTLLPFFFFGEALRIWETSRVGAIVAMPPLVTVFATGAVSALIPDYVKPEGLNAASYFGVALVVCGCMTGALGRPRAKASSPLDAGRGLARSTRQEA